MSDLNFVVRGKSETPARTVVSARQFQLVVDEPAELGGDDSGANPVEYILAGLVGCLNVVAHLIASELGFQIRSLEIRASGPLNPARLFGLETEDRAGYKRIEVDLDVDADVDQDTLDQWLAIVESRCPVFDNLSGVTPVRARLVAPVRVAA
jgi:uncharacterized OsmC-like protein